MALDDDPYDLSILLGFKTFICECGKKAIGIDNSSLPKCRDCWSRI